MNKTSELRYRFGKNWAEYIKNNFSEQVIDNAQAHLANFLKCDSLKGKTFLDIGCGSGLHSLAAHRMGADRVISFDYDLDSVTTTQLIRRHAGEPSCWSVMRGSVLDRAFMERLPKVEIVYSWGVLHHTGDMWQAIRNAIIPMKSDGLCYIALYSSDVHVDPPPEFWLKIKRAYNEHGSIRRRMMEWSYVMRFHIVPAIKSGKNFFHIARDYGLTRRGMNFWTDVKDWLGGYPMEFASLRDVQNFSGQELGLDLVNVLTGEACTEYLFARLAQNTKWRSIVEQRRTVPLKGPYSVQGRFAYLTRLVALQDQSDSADNPRRSRLMMYEQGQILGLAHSLHKDIADFGGGRFSHWGEDIYFSTSDNSDPNTNGRSYTYCEVY